MSQSLFREEPILKSSSFLLNVRLCMFIVAWAHLCVAAVVILPSDMSSDKDPRVRIYAHLKYWFITAWFNFINLCYLPLCIYCDWKEKRRQGNERLVSILRRIRDVVFTSILFPTILWADFMFWRFYLNDQTLISPQRLYDYVPAWGQHSLHTVSWIVAILDLILTPRRRPESVIPRLKLMIAFCAFYNIAILERYLKGEIVYQVLERFSASEAFLYVVMCYLEYMCFFTTQWIIIDWLWGKNNRKNQSTRVEDRR